MPNTLHLIMGCNRTAPKQKRTKRFQSDTFLRTPGSIAEPKLLIFVCFLRCRKKMFSALVQNRIYYSTTICLKTGSFSHVKFFCQTATAQGINHKILPLEFSFALQGPPTRMDFCLHFKTNLTSVT